MIEKNLSFIEDADADFDVNKLVKEVLANRYDHKATVPPAPDYLISIGGKGIALPGSIIGVYGPPKSRKSSLMGMIAGACLSKGGTYGNIESKIDGDILWFDTEQSDTEVQYFQNNIIKMAGTKDDDYIYSKYYAMKLRQYDEPQRLAIVDRIITAPDVFNNVGLIVLDGIADLIYNVNEIEASKKLVTRLTYWADKLQVPLIVALHTNKDGKDATGSLGGFLNKKSSYTIKCIPEFDGGPSTVRPYFTRNGQNFQPFMISNQGDDDEFPGMPIFYDPAEDVSDLGWINTKPRSQEVHKFDKEKGGISLDSDANLIGNILDAL